jgi:hypothetical protein
MHISGMDHNASCLTQSKKLSSNNVACKSAKITIMGYEKGHKEQWGIPATHPSF